MIAVIPAWFGDLDAGNAFIAPLRERVRPVVDAVAPMPYVALQSMLDAGSPKGQRNRWSGGFVPDVGPELVGRMQDAAMRLPSPLSQILVVPLTDAVRRLPDDATAFPARSGGRWLAHPVASWADPATDDVARAWVDELTTAIRAQGETGTYLNLEDADTSRVRWTMGEQRYRRLQQVKQAWDPAGRVPPLRSHRAAGGRPMRRTALGAVLVAGLALVSGCGVLGNLGGGAPTTAAPPAPTSAPATTQPPSGTAMVAEPVSSALPVEARDVRLVRSGASELALQFELVNGTPGAISANDLGVDPVEQLVMLADLAHTIGYVPLAGDRISASAAQDIPVGGSATITIVFQAPVVETGSMLVVVNGLVPVQVPVQPAGSAALDDDAVLRIPTSDDARTAPLRCTRSDLEDSPPAQAAVDLSAAGLSAEVRGVQRISGFALAQVALRNTTASDVPLEFVNDAYRDVPGELSLATGGETLVRPCRFDAPTYFGLVANPQTTFTRSGGSAVPAGATVVMWALFAAPPAGPVDIGIGGFPTPVRTQLGR